MVHRSDRTLLTLALGLCIAIWSTTWAAIRVGLHDVPPLTGAAVRFALAGARCSTWRWPDPR